MDEQELSRILEKLSQGIALTDAEMRKLAASSSATSKAMQNFASAASQGVKNLGSSIGGLTGSIAKGSASFTQFSGLVDTVSGSLGKMAEAIPFAGSAISGALKLVAEGSKFVLGQIEQTAQAFNDLGQVGGLTAKGMSDLQQQFLTSGQTLSGFTKAVANNAQALASFRGLTATGADDFSKIVGGIVDSNAGEELRRIGFSAEQMSEATANYITIQTRLGNVQKKSNTELTQSAVEYAKELDQLTRVTGLNRSEAMSEQKRVASEARFLTTRMDLEERLGKEGKRRADILSNATIQVGVHSKELARGLRDMSGGILDTDDAIKTLQTLGPEVLTLINGVKEGSVTQDEFIRGIQKLGKEYRYDVIRDQARINKEYDKTFANFVDLTSLTSAELVDGNLKAVKAQEEAVKGTDDLTNQTVIAQRSMEQMSRQIQNFGFTAMPAATEAVASFTTTVNEFIKKIGEKTGIKVPGIAGGATTPTAKPTTNLPLPQSLADLIARGESGAAGYNAANRKNAQGTYSPFEGGYTEGNKPLSDMTVQEVLDRQRAGKLHAAGRYQVIGRTLSEAVTKGFVKPEEKFNKETQDRLFSNFLIGQKRPAIQAYRTGKSNDVNAAIIELAKEFAAVGVPVSMYGDKNVRLEPGMSYYEGVAGNEASISPGEVKKVLEEERKKLGQAVGPAKTSPAAETSSPAAGLVPSGIAKNLPETQSTGTESIGPRLDKLRPVAGPALKRPDVAGDKSLRPDETTLKDSTKDYATFWDQQAIENSKQTTGLLEQLLSAVNNLNNSQDRNNRIAEQMLSRTD